MAGIIKNLQSIPIAINGTENHVHVLFVLSKNIALAKFVEIIKTNSSLWIKKQDSYYNTLGDF
jgi:putative transposase